MNTEQGHGNIRGAPLKGALVVCGLEVMSKLHGLIVVYPGAQLSSQNETPELMTLSSSIPNQHIINALAKLGINPQCTSVICHQCSDPHLRYFKQSLVIQGLGSASDVMAGLRGLWRPAPACGIPCPSGHFPRPPTA